VISPEGTIHAKITTIGLDRALSKENKASELGPRLETIPSIGPVTASALAHPTFGKDFSANCVVLATEVLSQRISSHLP